ncbi:MAG: ATP-binding cassette domain-containing protein [Methanosphaera sp.]|uniref:ATP-binding cassette domain-containing protein n=1 Tax=Methanosphaera sp. TaxID=2666342 RepID=UPI0025DD543D|nr:ATP-binding cassette domain-containing protein [Methanosphaera sp.]MCI5867745.1 ATP-binding cassette domain-containing protein [Methanosphaera sp.]MDD6535296.1 ATP-binding cassette domain-containing protein [Methanosphaera sp.]MDY3956457.1 ATP-binding cassette domain-containing protein [Methanosphaera sp.]
MSDIILETKDLKYNYPDGTEALKGISIQIHEGEMISLMGTNGAGKSTLFLHFNGIIEPTSGTVEIEGEELKYNKKSLLKARSKVGIVFQNPDDQLFAPTVIEDVSFGPMNMGLSEEEVKARSLDALEKVGMADYTKKAPHHLSGGQKKRVAIAGILAMQPRIMVLDEPTSGLDPKGASKIMQLLYDLNREGMTIIISTHDVDLVPLYSDDVKVITDGRIIKEGNCREVFTDHATIEEANLRLPWIAELFEKLSENPDVDFKYEGYPLTAADAYDAVLKLLNK